MTLHNLYQLSNLKREIQDIKNEIIELQALAESITAPMSDMPHGAGGGDKVGTYATMIADCKKLLEEKKRECHCEYKMLLNYIFRIDDSLTRTIFFQRFVKNKEWEAVAEYIGSSEYAVKQICYRYIAKN